jgi:uncharacterized SAM-binding protein YcdF (DUF218 family)
MLAAVAAKALKATLRFQLLAARGQTKPATPLLRVVLWLILPFATSVALLAGHGAILRLLGSFLVVDEPLQPAAAIVVLAGQMPQRETEAAAIYRDGWAPRVVLVPGADQSITHAGARPANPDWQVRRDLLVRLGVPAEAITIADGGATGTREELELAQQVIPATAERVILVSSKFHTRRVLLAWQQTAPASLPAIVRVARRDPFDPDGWWLDAQMRAVVMHEYLGLLDLVVPRVWPVQLDPTNA